MNWILGIIGRSLGYSICLKFMDGVTSIDYFEDPSLQRMNEFK